MNRSNPFAWIAAVMALVVLGGGAWFLFFAPYGEAPIMAAKDDMPRYRAGAFEGV